MTDRAIATTKSDTGRSLQRGAGRAWMIAGACCLLVAAVADAAAGRLYRYQNDEGRTEMSHSIPGEAVARGYDVLDAGTLRVIERVPPQPSPEELAARQERERAAEACRQELRRVHALYGSERDIETAENQVLRSLATRIEHTETNLVIERKRLEDTEQQAAHRERTGRPVSAELIRAIERSRAHIQALEEEIAQRRGEQEDARRRFANERRAFTEGTCAAATDRT
jgi:hypothetical protein